MHETYFIAITEGGSYYIIRYTSPMISASKWEFYSKTHSKFLKIEGVITLAHKPQVLLKDITPDNYYEFLGCGLWCEGKKTTEIKEIGRVETWAKL